MWVGRGTLAASSTRLWHRGVVPIGAAGLLLLLVVLSPAALAGAAASSSQGVSVGKLLVTLQDPRASAVDYFGASLAISGSTAVVGSPGNEALAGAAYVYVDSGPGWQTVPTATLDDPMSKDHDYFGESVAVSNKTIVVGAPGTTTNAGAVYIYVNGTSGWPTTPTTVLTDPEATAGDDFGRSVAVSGKTIVVGGVDPSGAIGKAYIYTKGSSSWPSAPSFTITDPAPKTDDEFGASVAVSGRSAIVGAYAAKSVSGRAYIYVDGQSGWPARPTIVLSDPLPKAGDEFGASIGVSGSSAIVSSPAKRKFTGRTYLYSKTSSHWQKNPTVKQNDPRPKDDEFGVSVAVSGDTALVGSYGAKGLAYLYVKGESGWRTTPTTTLSDPAAKAGDEFGKTVAVSGTAAIVGGPGTNAGEGAAYVFRA
jgi:hypothetical protein